MKRQQWWGYRHSDGSYQTKPYFQKLDIEEALESPFCDIVVGPFDAKDREDALLRTQIEVKKQIENIGVTAIKIEV